MANPPQGDWLQDIAELLISRHINVSISDRRLREKLLAEEPELWETSQRKIRCIAVVGAGASAPVLARGDDLASGLIQQFNIEQAAVAAEKERIERITAVDPTEFEAQLSAIGQTLGNSRRVQAAISDLYNVRHPTILSYELLAHLLKHRFLDAIISMNFDELLDQSLEDELGIGEYERIVSDRDCVNVQSDISAPDYLPLYIKLHGTASEPESIRFTRESYYDSPVQVGTEAARLFRTSECVVLNLGFGMGSFDLHRLLAIPDKLWLFNLSAEPLTLKAETAIRRERERHRKGESNFRESPENEKKRAAGKAHEEDEETKSRASDKMMDELLVEVDRRVTGISQDGPFEVMLRSVQRHRTIVGLLGPDSTAGKRLVDLPRSSDPHLSLDPLIRSTDGPALKAEYLLRRTMLELALAMARGRGLLSVATLAVDRGGLYYDSYCRSEKKRPMRWKDVYETVGFKQNDRMPDVFEAMDEVCRNGPSDEKRVYDDCLKPDSEDPTFGQKVLEIAWQELPQLDVDLLVERVIPHIVDSPGGQEKELLAEGLQQLLEGTEYEIHSRDDRVCSKTFSWPKTLKTLSSLEAHSFDLLKGAGDGGDVQVDIISEAGDWLLQRKEEFGRRLTSSDKIRLIVAFLYNVEELWEKFPGAEIRYLHPWHHNRHMVIQRKQPRMALYFARHHRTPYVTPVLVKARSDIQVLRTTFKNRWDHATPVERDDPPSHLLG